jgi:hypothetical protein
VPDVALRVNVVVVVVVCRNVPVTVPLVNGVVRDVGELIPSVLVMFALAGVEVYVAANAGFVIEVPISTTEPPVNELIANAPDVEMVIIVPDIVTEIPVPAVIVIPVDTPLAVPTRVPLVAKGRI